MPSKPLILVNNLFYAIPESLVQFERVTLSFAQRHYGIVGDNGSGKTTLLKLIANLIEPWQGSIQINGSLHYASQNYEPLITNKTISETLEISKKLKALARIRPGNMNSDDASIIGDDWDIEARAKQLLADFYLRDINWERNFLSLSKGQQTKCLLIRAMLADTDFILFDEPTNNLDSQSRNQLVQWIKILEKGLLIVSHDSYLLDQMDDIIEITVKGIHRYGGKYTFYKEQKSIQQQSLEKGLFEAERIIKITQKNVQKIRENHERRTKKGKMLRKQHKIDKISANSMKGRSEKTQSRNTTQADQMIGQAEKILAIAKSQLQIKTHITANLAATRVPNAKMVVAIKDLHFAYVGQKLLFDNFNLTIIGPERIALSGNNGSGKTTLIKLLLGDIQPLKGNIKRGVNVFCYLDQQVSFLDSSLSLMANFQRLNPELSTRDSYFALASFNFRNKEAEKMVTHLSGGERFRAGLAISLLSKTPPQLIILDEPTNHLDIRSIEAIEKMLKSYEGAMIVISHDYEFLQRIGINRNIIL